MISTIDGLPPGIDGVRVSGTVTRADYDDVVAPLVAAAAATGRRLRVVAVLDSSFTGITPSGYRKLSRASQSPDGRAPGEAGP